MGCQPVGQRAGPLSGGRRIVQPLGLSLVHQRERIALRPYITTLPLITHFLKVPNFQFLFSQNNCVQQVRSSLVQHV